MDNRIGEDIRIYSDLWIPMKLGFRVEGRPPDAHASEPRVDDLIGPTGRWNMDVVREAVGDADAELITRIHLPRTATRDEYIWLHSKDGKPGARSVYHRLRAIQHPGTEPNGSASQDPDLWKAIWGAHVIPKI